MQPLAKQKIQELNRCPPKGEIKENKRKGQLSVTPSQRRNSKYFIAQKCRKMQNSPK
jgi:hypothetical protein